VAPPRFAVIANSPTQVNQAIFFSLAIIIVGFVPFWRGFLLAPNPDCKAAQMGCGSEAGF
jgi:hypothetical protein